MGTLLRDLRFALRQLVRAPAFTAVAVLSLALGIGANVTVFTVVNALLLRPPPVRDPGTLVALFTTDERQRGPFLDFLPTSGPNLDDYAAADDALSGLSRQVGIRVSFAAAGGDPEQVVAEMVSGSYFDLLGVVPALGRVLAPDDDRTPGERPVAVLSHGFWLRRLGGEPAAVGRTVFLNGHAFTVVGVAPPGFKGVNGIAGPSLWVPTMAHPQLATGFLKANLESRRALLWNAVGRLPPGVKRERAEAGLRTVAARLARDHPTDNAGRSVTLLPLAQASIHPGFRRNMTRTSALLAGAVGLVLLIACANVANLLLARAAARQREVAVRLSLGAPRARLVRQLLTEGVLLAALAGTLAVLFAWWAQGLLWAHRPPTLPADAFDFAPGLRVVGFTAGVSLLTALAFALAPAWTASRPDLVSELKQRTGDSAGAGRPWSARNLLVSGQVALCLVALVAAGLFVRSLRRAQGIASGFDHDRLAVLSVDLAAAGYDEARGRALQRAMLERVRSLPGVERATLASRAPLLVGGFLRTVFPEGVDATDPANARLVQLESVEPGYFETVGVTVLQGRGLAEGDHAESPRVAVVNETLGRRFWPGQPALGRRFRLAGQEDWHQVVGVARDAQYEQVGEDPAPHAYVSLRQSWDPAASLLLRATGDPAPPLGLARREVQALDRALPVTNVLTYAAIRERNLWSPRTGAWLLGSFGALSLVLAMVGVYGVTAYSVGLRTREMGVRLTLGARRRDVLLLVVGQALLLAGIGIAAGLLLAFAATRAASGLLVGVGTHDPLVFATVPLLLMAAVVAASAWPAWRATRVDPAVALGAE